MEPTTMAALSLAQPLFNAGVGLWQTIKAKQLENDLSDRPIRTLPPELQEALSRNKFLATQRRLPSQSIIEDKMRGGTASAADAISKMTSGGEGLGAIADLYSGEQKKISDLGIAGERNWLDTQNRLTQLQQVVGQEEQKNWEWNEAQPYLNELDIISKLRSGGLQNLSGSVGAGTKNMLYLNELYPNNKTTSNNKTTDGYIPYSTQDLLNYVG